MVARIKVVAGLIALGLVVAAVPALARTKPANDDFASAESIAGLPFSTSVDTRGAGLELGERQPSCTDTRATVWFRYVPSEDINLVAETTGTFPGTLAIYSGSSFADLFESGCAGGGTASKVVFRGVGGHAYFIQVGSASKKRGIVDLSVARAAWQEKGLTSITRRVEVPGTKVPLVSFHGRPRAANPNIYDITLVVAGQTRVDRGVLTFGLVQEEQRVDLLELPGHSGELQVDIGYRYDRTQYQCLTDGGEGSSCNAASPIQDLDWLTSGDGSRAELVIHVVATKDELIKAERTIFVPYAGQALGMLP